MIDQIVQIIPTYVLALFRVAAMMLSAPMLGSTRIPMPVKVLLALGLTVGLCVHPHAPTLPDSSWALAVGIAGEILFGLSMGMAVGFVFVAAQAAGEIISNQMALHISAMFDPQYGGAGSAVGDLYYLMCLIIFMTVGGHHDMIRALHQSFDTLPLLSAGFTPGLLDLTVALLQTCMQTAVMLAFPMFITMLVIDVVLGFLGKTMPQLNIMSAGLTIRLGAGFLIAIVSIGLCADILVAQLNDHLVIVEEGYAGKPVEP